MSVRRDAAGRRTGTRILDAALELFNREGTPRVTTNHVAAHLGISPGNLYYWYADKPAIVRALWARYDAARTALWEDDADALPSPAETLDRLLATADLGRTYRFLLRDGAALAHTDAELGRAIAAARLRRLHILGALARTWRADGLVRTVPEDRLDALVDALWTLTESWPVHASGAADSAEPGLERVLRAVLEPYLAA